MDAQAHALAPHVLPMIETLLTRRSPDYGVLPCGWLPVDIDTFVMDNGGTFKEGVGRSYAGVDGYCPLASYIGAHGFCLELQLRPGTQHSAKGTQDNLQRVIPLAQRLSAAGAEGAAAGAAGLGVRLGRADEQHRGAECAWPAAGGLAHQVEPAQH